MISSMHAFHPCSFAIVKRQELLYCIVSTIWIAMSQYSNIMVVTVTVKPAMFQIIAQLEAPTLSEEVTETECPLIVIDT